MILSKQTEFSSKMLGDEKTVELIAKAGFDAIDYSMFEMRNDDYILNSDEYESHVKKVKTLADGYGLFFNQSHSPFPSYKVDDDSYNKVIFERLRRSLEISGILGIKNVVVHPTDFQVKSEENLKKNAEFYNRLVPFCKEYGVKIAVENMFGHDSRRAAIIPNICSMPDEFCRMMDMLDPTYFTACVDIGHAGLVGTTAPELIRSLGHDRVTCLHVHDNNYREDMHVPPFFADLDWSEITQALADIDYSGDLTFEADTIFHNFPTELFPSVFTILHDIGRYLISQIEMKKKL